MGSIDKMKLEKDNNFSQLNTSNGGSQMKMEFLQKNDDQSSEEENMSSQTTAVEYVKETFLKVGESETCLLTLGNLEDSKTSETSGKRAIFLIIPGNPGVPYFYEDFMHELYNNSGGQIPVWTVGHAGHVQPQSESLTVSHVVSTDANLYNLQAQIAHKVKFVQEHVPSDVSIILVGHSIGCYMILNMLDELPGSRVLRCFMLFPTVERMALSPNGKYMTPLFNYLRWLIVVMTLFIVILPNRIRNSLFSNYFKDVDYPKCIYSACMRSLTPWTTNMVTYLAKTEMKEVTELQGHLIKKHINKLSFYYGSSDDWAPVQYFYDLKTAFPDVDAKLCQNNFKHAFVLEKFGGKGMAEIVWHWVMSCNYPVLSDIASQDNKIQVSLNGRNGKILDDI